MSKRKIDEISKKKLLIPTAKYGKVGGTLKDITPDGYKDMKEVQAAVKSGESCLQCPDGHDLVFRNESKDGRRRAHFAHKHDCHNCLDGCNYIKKYGGKGESPEHLQAKLRFGLQPRVVFRVECEQVCGNYIRTVEVPKEWTYKTEQRLTMTDGKYIWVDGAFSDEAGVIQLVVEVKHTHGTPPDKLKWLQNQAFEFFEVEAKTVQNSQGGVVSINHTNDHRLCGACDKRISEAIRREKERLEAQKKHDENVRQCLALEKIEEAEMERQARIIQEVKSWISYPRQSLSSASINIRTNKKCVLSSMKKNRDVCHRKELANIKDKARKEEEIIAEVEKIKGELSGREFLSLTVGERTDAIRKFRTHDDGCKGICDYTKCFVSARVNERLWGIPPTKRVIQSTIKNRDSK